MTTLAKTTHRSLRRQGLQAVTLPLLVDTSKAVDSAAGNLQRMMNMDVPASAPATAPTSDVNAFRQLFGYAPAATVDWRLSLLRSGNLTDEAIKSIQVPAVLLCSMKDRLFPSMQEGARWFSMFVNVASASNGATEVHLHGVALEIP